MKPSFDLIQMALNYVPFAAMVMGQRTDDKRKLRTMSEELIKIAVAVIIGLYVNDRAQDDKIERLTALIEQQAATNSQDHKQIWAQIDRQLMMSRQINRTDARPSQ